MKDHIRKENVNLSFLECEQLVIEFFESFDDAEWTKYIEHVMKVKDKYLSVAGEIPVSV